MKNREYYINIYNKLVKEDREDYIKKHGNDDGWDSRSIDMRIAVTGNYKGTDRIDAIVGYYLAWYDECALNVWLSNSLLNEPWISKECDKEITTILQGLFSE